MSKEDNDFLAEALDSMNEEAQKEAEREEFQASIEEWDPNEGELLAGELISVEKKLTKYGVGYEVLVKDATDSLVQVWCKAKALVGQLIDASPKVGSLVAFRYDGEGESAAGYTYKKYKVRGQEADPKLWASLTNLTDEEKFKLEQLQAGGGSGSSAASKMDDDLDAPF